LQRGERPSIFALFVEWGEGEVAPRAAAGIVGKETHERKEEKRTKKAKIASRARERGYARSRRKAEGGKIVPKEANKNTFGGGRGRENTLKLLRDDEINHI